MKKRNISLVPHRVWHKFSSWLIKTYGQDLHGKWQIMKVKNPETKKVHKIRFRSFNELELSRRLVGYDVMCKVKRYVERYVPEIKIVHVDDAVYAGSDILLIPHPKMGITILFIPQCTSVQNEFFLYEGHYKMLMKALKEMKTVYKEKL